MQLSRMLCPDLAPPCNDATKIMVTVDGRNDVVAADNVRHGESSGSCHACVSQRRTESSYCHPVLSFADLSMMMCTPQPLQGREADPISGQDHLCLTCAASLQENRHNISSAEWHVAYQHATLTTASEPRDRSTDAGQTLHAASDMQLAGHADGCFMQATSLLYGQKCCPG